MTTENKNVKRIVAPDFATLSSSLMPKMFGLNQADNTAYFMRSDSVMVGYTPIQGNADFSTLKVTGTSGNGGNLAIDVNGNVYQTSFNPASNTTWLEKVINFYDLSSGDPAGVVTGDRYIATVTGGDYTKDYVYEKTDTGWSETIVGEEGYFVYVDALDSVYLYNGTAWVVYASGSTTFLGLSDTPNNYTGNSLKSVRVNATEDGLEFYTPLSGLWEVNGDIFSPITDHLFTQLGNNPSSPLGKLDIYVDPTGASTITVSGATDTNSNGVYTQVGLSQDGVTYYYNHTTTTRQIIRDSTNNYYCIDNKVTNTNPAYNSTEYCNFTGSLTGSYLGLGGNAGNTATAVSSSSSAGIGLNTNGSVNADNGFFIDGYSSITYDKVGGHLQIDTLASTTGADFVFNSNGIPRLVVPVGGDGLGAQFMRSGFFGGYEYQNRLLVDDNIDSANLIFDTNFVNFNTFSATPTDTEIAKPDVGIAGALQVIDGILIGNSITDGFVNYWDGGGSDYSTIDFDYLSGTHNNFWKFGKSGYAYFRNEDTATTTKTNLEIYPVRWTGSETDTGFEIGFAFDYQKIAFSREQASSSILNQTAQIDVIWDDSGTTTDPYFNTIRDVVVGTPKTEDTDYSQLSDTGLLVNGLSALHYYKNSQINAGEILNHYGFSFTTQYHNYADLKAVDGLLLEHYSGDGSNSNSTQNIIGDSSDGFTFYKHHFGTSPSVDESNTFVFSLLDETVNGYQSYLYKNDPLNDGTFPYTTEFRQYRDAFEWMQNDVTVAILDNNTFDISGNDLTDTQLPEDSNNIRTGDYTQLRFADPYNIQMITNAYVESGAWKYARGGSVEASNLWLSTGGINLQYGSGTASAGDALTWTDLLEVKSDKCEYKGKSIINPTMQKVLVDVAPEVGDNFGVWLAPVNGATIKKVVAVGVGATPNLTYSITSNSNRDGSGIGSVNVNSQTCNSSTAGNLATIADNSVAGSDWVFVTIDSITTAPDVIEIYLEYEEN